MRTFNALPAWSGTRAGNLLLLLFLLAAGHVPAQQIATIGTGIQSNGPNAYPAPYGNAQNGARHQILIRASEMVAAGMTEGTIESIAFDVSVPAGTPLQDFQVRMGTTTAQTVGNNYFGGLTTVWTSTAYSETAGWNTHVLLAPFNWDGIANIVIETCFSNPNNTQNAQMRRSASGFNSVLYRATPNGNVCNSGFGNLQNSQDRPNIQLGWLPLSSVPVAAFTAEPEYSCDGTIQFTDASLYLPNDRLWDFGDGNTSIDQDPIHTYQSDGVHTVTLIVTNAFGSDTVANTVEVNVTGPRPVPACIPNTLASIQGLGIVEFSYANSTYASEDASVEGYVDNSCRLDTLLLGAALTIHITTGPATTHNVRCWVDWNNNGLFSAGELVLSQNNVMQASATVIVPSTAVVNTPLRVRAMAEYDLSPAPTACADLQYGQAEDHGLVILPNPLPPVAGFSAAPTYTCGAPIQFTDASLNAPTGWTWAFGDGNSSASPSPQHTYTADGVYTVQLIVVNANGSDTITFTDLITVDLGGQTVPAQCVPATQNYCCGYGLLGLQFAGINSTSGDGAEGYVDRSCGNTAIVEESINYPVVLTVGAQNPHDVRIWIDLDNDGAFTANELVLEALPLTGPNTSITIPTGAVLNTPLRMRVQADIVGTTTGPCAPPLFGQVEDFSIIIGPNTQPPVADLMGEPLVSCDGVVQFTDLSTGGPLFWSWDFGDGNGSPQQSPQHTYAGPGVYSVSLSVQNNNGSDTFVRNDYITVVEPAFCDTIALSGNMDLTAISCTGVLTDDGGAFDDYSPGFSGAMTIAPPGADHIILSFQTFAFETNTDFLRIHDGPSTASPLIGEYTGNGIGALPNNGIIASTGPSITLQQAASFGQINWSGFILNWTCSTVGLPEHEALVDVTLVPNPARNSFVVRFNGAEGGAANIFIHNALGEQMEERTARVGGVGCIFDASSWPSGCYYVAITTSSGRTVRKLMIE